MTIRATRKDANPEYFINGIPNRNLTEEEYQALDADQRALVRSSGLYDVKTDKEMSGSAPKPAAPEGGGG